MDLGAIIEVAVGLIFVWIVLSLATIQIQEWVNALLDKRAKDMEAAIHEMLANPNLKAQFYDHPVIRGLTAKKNRKEPSRIPPWFYKYPILRGFTKEKRRLPSYIPSQQFALALFDVAITAGTEASVIQHGILSVRDDLEKAKGLPISQAVIDELNLLADFARSAAATEAGTAITNRTVDLLKKRIDQFIEKFNENHPDQKLSPDVQVRLRVGLERALEEAKRVKGEIDDVLAKQPKMEESGLAKVRRGVAALSVISPEVSQTLNALLQNAQEYAAEKEKGFAQARSNVEGWFNDSMARVSGAFKRYSQWMALVVGFIVALLLNVDSINLTLYLWREPAVRQALATKADQFELPQDQLASNPEQALQSFRDQFAGLSLPIGWGVNDGTTISTADNNCQMFPNAQQSFGIPIPFTTRCVVPPQADSQTNLLLKLIGFLLTAVAAAQGAPFWFDILKKVVNLRSTGANPDEKGK